MDILFQIHYEWNKELFCLYYQTQNRKYRRILLFFCGAVIIFSFCLCSKIGREMIMTMMILFVCAVILINNIYLRLATYIQMETALKQYGTAKKNIGTTNAASTVTLPSEVNEDALFDKEMTFIWERCVKKESFSFLFCFWSFL